MISPIPFVRSQCLRRTMSISRRIHTRGNPNYFLTNGNGKSVARVQDHLRPNGAHRWHNYMKAPNEVKLEEAAALHYKYAKFSDLTSRRELWLQTYKGRCQKMLYIGV